MKPESSPLRILDFAILNFNLDFIHSQNDEKDLNYLELFANYDLDIDFNISVGKLIRVFMTANINTSELKLPGYSISANVACVFNFDDTKNITKDVKESIEGFSTIYITLNTLRGFISQITANGPIGRYILPSIDLNDLINQKKSTISAEDSEPSKLKRKSKTALKKRNKQL